MKHSGNLAFLFAVLAAVLHGCGQDAVTLPESHGALAGGVCGTWFPGETDADAGTGGAYGVDPGQTFPCPVWQSARQDGKPTYLNIGEEYLRLSNKAGGHRAIAVVIAAKECPACAALIQGIAERADEFDQAKALMIGMARRSLLDSPEEPYFEIEESAEVLEDEGWPMDRWPVINDAEGYFDKRFDDGTPWTVLVRVSDMEVVSASNVDFAPTAEGVSSLLERIAQL